MKNFVKEWDRAKLFTYIYTSHFANKIVLTSDDLLLPQPKLAVDYFDVIHGEAAQHLFDGGVQILPGRAR